MEFLWLATGLLVGAVIAILVYQRIVTARHTAANTSAQDLMRDAERRAHELGEDALRQAQKRAEDLRAQIERELESRRGDLDRRERRIEGVEEAAERRMEALEGREQKLLEREKELDRQKERVLSVQTELDHRAEALTAAADEHRRALERIAGLTTHEARDSIIKQVEDEAKRDALAMVREYEMRAREEAERRARKIVCTAIQRLGTEQAQEASVSVLQLPSEDMKGRIIGREGRNIRHFEQVTGVNLIIDDTPEAVILSCFDPVRREVGRLTLEALVSDGRVNPSRIEEQYERARSQIEQEIKSAGEEAIIDVGLTNVHPELSRALGRLKFRYSYGQNVLRHLVEAAHIAGMIAAELGSDVRLAKRCTVFHDIGKAVAHEVEGSHAFIGAELARRLGEDPAVCHAIEAHHNEVEMRTLEAVITQAADAISGSRPGARRESFEAYVKRLQRLEEIAMSFPGVDKVYAMQAGREVRVMVRPADIDDVAAQLLAREVAKKVEEELQYPGQIKVMVLREIRSVEYAR